VRPGLLGQLYGESADATTRAVDEYPLTGPQLGVFEQRLPGVSAAAGSAAAEARGIVPGAAANAAAGAATNSAAAPSAVMGRKPITWSPVAQLVTPSPSRTIVPATSIPGMCGSATGKTCCRLTRADPGVDRVERGRRDLDQHLARRRVGLRCVLVAQNARVAVGVEPYCLHGSLLRSPARE
jgi:hypothetical protein